MIMGQEICQLTGDDVTPGGGHVVGGHEPEAEEGEQDPPVADQVGHEHEDVLSLGQLAEGFLQVRHDGVLDLLICKSRLQVEAIHKFDRYSFTTLMLGVLHIRYDTETVS